MNISDILGKTFTKINVSDDTINFLSSDGRKYVMYHDQDCCEHVYIEDICGNIDDIKNSPILQAEESSSSNGENLKGDESFTWTFYKIATIKGSLTIRWYGSSNGYYSEGVSFEEVMP